MPSQEWAPRRLSNNKPHSGQTISRQFLITFLVSIKKFVAATNSSVSQRRKFSVMAERRLNVSLGRCELHSRIFPLMPLGTKNAFRKKVYYLRKNATQNFGCRACHSALWQSIRFFFIIPASYRTEGSH